MRKPYLLLLVLAFPGAAFAQSDVDGSLPREDRIETDRDSFTPSTRLAGVNRLIAEAAYSFVEEAHGNAHSFPELLFRYGVCKRLEFRLGWNYELGGGTEISGATSIGDDVAARVDGRISRENRISYGVKVGLTEQEEFIPESALILQGSTPTGGANTTTHFTATYVFGWELPHRWMLDAALRYGYQAEEGDRFNVWAPSVVLKVPVLERWNAHVEYFGVFTSGRHENFAKHYISPGVHYLLTDNLEVGVRVGWGLSDDAARFFCNAGFGYRF